MNSINLKQTKKGSLMLLAGFLLLSVITYSDVKSKGLLTLLLFIVSIGVLLSFVSLIMIFLPKSSEKKIKIACIIMLFVLNLGFFNLWLTFIDKPVYDINVVIIFSLLSCVLGYYFEKKRNAKKDKQINKTYSLLPIIMSCLGIIFTRIIALFLHQNQIVDFGKLIMEFGMMFLLFIIGMGIYQIKINSVQ